MVKQQQSKTAIVKPPQRILANAADDITATIVGHLQAFAAIDKRELTPELISLYVNTICNHKPTFSGRQIEKGLQAYLETGKKWPWPSDLIECMEDEI